MNLFASDVVEYAGAPTCLVQEGGGRGNWVENRLGVSVRPRAVPVRALCVYADLAGERERARGDIRSGMCVRVES